MALEAKLIEIPTVCFYNGEKCPMLGLGTWKSDEKHVQQAVEWAISAGYVHVDCAHIYNNEKEIGKSFSKIFASGRIQRNHIFITSKLWNTHHRPDLVKCALEQTLKDLQLKCLNLYLMHWPTAFKEDAGDNPTDSKGGKTLYSNVPFTDTWREMEKLVASGKVKSIGISNFNEKQINKLLETARIKPVVNQVECHPYLNQKNLKDCCEYQGIRLQAYSPLGSPDRPWASTDNLPVLLYDERIKAIAAEHVRTPAQILLRYQIERGNITLVKSVQKDHIEENIKIFDFCLSENMPELNALDRSVRYCHLNWIKDHPDYPFHD